MHVKVFGTRWPAVSSNWKTARFKVSQNNSKKQLHGAKYRVENSKFIPVAQDDCCLLQALKRAEKAPLAATQYRSGVTFT